MPPPVDRNAASMARGTKVLHLGHDQAVSPHQLTDGARSENGLLVYDVGISEPLPTSRSSTPAHHG